MAPRAHFSILAPWCGGRAGGGPRPGPRAPSPATQLRLPTLYVDYTMNCTFSIVDDSGKPVTSIAPGTYQVDVSTPIMFKLAVPGGPGVDRRPRTSTDFTGCKGWVQFQLSGPGVSLFTTLDVGCGSSIVLPAGDVQGELDLHGRRPEPAGRTQTSFSTPPARQSAVTRPYTRRPARGRRSSSVGSSRPLRGR